MRYTNLIDLVDDNNWVLDRELLQLLNEDARLAVHVGALATLNVDGVILAAHRYHCCGPLQALANRFRDRSFSDARRTSEQDDHAFFRVHSLALGNELKDALLCFPHPVMAVFQDPPRKAYVPEYLCPLVPWKSEHLVKIGNLAGCVGVVLVLETIDLLLHQLPCSLGHLLDGVELLLELGLFRSLSLLEQPLV